MRQTAALPGVPAPARGTAGTIHILSATDLAAETEFRIRRGSDLVRQLAERPLSGRTPFVEARALREAKDEARGALMDPKGDYRMSSSEIGALVISLSGNGSVRSFMERRVREVILVQAEEETSFVQS